MHIHLCTHKNALACLLGTCVDLVGHMTTCVLEFVYRGLMYTNLWGVDAIAVLLWLVCYTCTLCVYKERVGLTVFFGLREILNKNNAKTKTRCFVYLEAVLMMLYVREREIDGERER